MLTGVDTTPAPPIESRQGQCTTHSKHTTHMLESNSACVRGISTSSTHPCINVGTLITSLAVWQEHNACCQHMFCSVTAVANCPSRYFRARIRACGRLLGARGLRYGAGPSAYLIAQQRSCATLPKCQHIRNDMPQFHWSIKDHRTGLGKGKKHK